MKVIPGGITFKDGFSLQSGSPKGTYEISAVVKEKYMYFLWVSMAMP